MNRRLLPLFLLALAACGGNEQVPGGPGAALFHRLACVSCHGPEGGGKPALGPAIREAGEHWDAESLKRYLRDPAGYAARDPRLGTRPMPAIPAATTEEELDRLVEHVLELMAEG